MSKRVLPIALILLALVFAVLAVAWIDGGNEDLRAISQPVQIGELGA